MCPTLALSPRMSIGRLIGMDFRARADTLAGAYTAPSRAQPAGCARRTICTSVIFSDKWIHGSF